MIAVNAPRLKYFIRTLQLTLSRYRIRIPVSDYWYELLSMFNIEAARSMLQIYPADEMTTEPKRESPGEARAC